jgi:hypothetical protein
VSSFNVSYSTSRGAARELAKSASVRARLQDTAEDEHGSEADRWHATNLYQDDQEAMRSGSIRARSIFVLVPAAVLFTARDSGKSASPRIGSPPDASMMLISPTSLRIACIIDNRAPVDRPTWRSATVQ